MNIQIFGRSKCFDTKKAERYFKERRIKYQYIDLLRYGLSGKEFDAVLRGVGGIDNLIDWNSKSDSITLMKYMDDARGKHCCHNNIGRSRYRSLVEQHSAECSTRWELKFRV